jgi:hypothetical protein
MSAIGGKHWLVTINTYGTWLPGDPRGFQTRRARQYVPPPPRFAKPGEKTYDPADYRGLHAHADGQLDGGPTHFDERTRDDVLDELIRRINEIAIAPRILSLDHWHAHLLARFGRLDIGKTMGWLKARVTLMLRLAGWTRPIWAKQCDMRSKETPEAAAAAYQYVLDHANKGARVYEWEGR